MRAIFVPLRPETLERLVLLARAGRRHPRDQAALLLERALAAPNVLEHEARLHAPEAECARLRALLRQVYHILEHEISAGPAGPAAADRLLADYEREAPHAVRRL